MNVCIFVCIFNFLDQKWRKFEGKAISVVENASVSFMNASLESICRSKCRNQPNCSAFGYNSASKNCTLNFCGRIKIKEESSSSSVYVKGLPMRTIHLTLASLLLGIMYIKEL